jgi:succinate dehydrogenase / fumarate reductase iron-sulfur subunit
MPGATPRLPERYRSDQAGTVPDFHISELAADVAGAMSPFGPDVEFPLPLDRIDYRHPTPAEWPHRAGG